MAELTTRRQHLAKRMYGKGGLSIRCSCGKYTPVAGTVRQQEDAHRAHRVAMGERIKERALSPLEKARDRIAELEAENAALVKALGLNESAA
ncbi:hypothetical protein [Streptomyces sp. SID2119]|uniref:hypothetical protein n=1 Tax=Streptomyces sp. SID2119 TaxID=2690253 RepID=UPI00136F32A6|nr:hypothetical protein [Streptomyces sp. SID2119]MYW30136.1 hypothetical protein [Streptomyces sp. SID2119]